jgi:hypothetical protein
VPARTVACGVLAPNTLKAVLWTLAGDARTYHKLRRRLGCVQPLVTSWSRRAEDLTCDKTDEKDAVLIACLTAQLRCKQAAGASHPRHLGTSVTSPVITGSPARRLLNPITRCRDQPRNRYAGTDDGRGTGQKLDADRLTLMTGRSLPVPSSRSARRPMLLPARPAGMVYLFRPHHEDEHRT